LRVLVTGAKGQLGQALINSFPEEFEVIACGRSELDLVDATACHEFVERHRPDWVLNAAAYTAVDRAEHEQKLAHAVNVAAPAAFAAVLARTGGRMLQVSTDFVFDGSQGSPYQTQQPVAPLGVYGASKAAGELEVQSALGDHAYVLRTGWVYGPVGSNFLLSMLRLHALKAASGEPLSVVADQVGCPTSAAGLAAACWRVIVRGRQLSSDSKHGQPLLPIFHWSDAGVASWYDFAIAIGELAVAAGLLQQSAFVQPITTADYPTLARRPSYSLLDCSSSWDSLGLEPKHWREALQSVIAELAAR